MSEDAHKIRHYAAYGRIVRSDRALAFPVEPETPAPDRCVELRQTHSPVEIPAEMTLVHEVPDFPGGPVLRIYMDEGGHRAVIDYAGWRACIDEETCLIGYARTSPTEDVAWRFVVERVVLPLWMLVHEDAMLALHGGAVERQHRGVILIGESGAGKSTGALAMVRRGCALICDDLAMVDTAAGEVLPAAPSLRIWGERPEESTEDVPVAGTSGNKRWHRLSDAFATRRTRPISAVIVLAPAEDAPETGRVERMRGAAALAALLRFSFEVQHPPTSWQRRRMTRARVLIKSIGVWRCVYRRSADGTPRHIDGILTWLDERGGDV